MISKALATVLAVAAFAIVQPVVAICPSGQMAVGREWVSMFTGPGGAFIEYSGYLMANDCGIISQNGLTQDKNQMCSGGYFHGASVTCDGNHQPIAAVDTQGQSWSCYAHSESGCNDAEFELLACCTRN